MNRDNFIIKWVPCMQHHLICGHVTVESQHTFWDAGFESGVQKRVLGRHRHDMTTN